MLAGSMYRKGEKVHFTAVAASPDLCALHETRIRLTTTFIQFFEGQDIRPDNNLEVNVRTDVLTSLTA